MLTPPSLIGYIAFSADPALPLVGVLNPVPTTDPTWNGMLASLNMNAFMVAPGTIVLRLGPPALTAAALPVLDASSDAWRYSQTPAGALVPATTPGGAARVLCQAIATAQPVITHPDANTWNLAYVPAAGAAIFFSIEAVAGVVF